MGGSIEGGGGHIPSFEYDPEVMAEIAQENAETIEKHTGAKPAKHKDTVQKSADDKAKAAAFVTSDPDNPAIPPGLSNTKVKEKLDGAVVGEKGISAQMMADIPESAKQKGGPSFEGMKDGVGDIAKVSAASTNFLAGIEGVNAVPLNDQVANITVGEPGPVDPASSPLQQNVQMLVNDGEFLKNTAAISGAQAQEMEEGPAKDSLMAFLANIDKAIADLKGILDKIQSGEGVAGKESMGKAAVTELADWNAAAAKRQEEADKEKEKGKGGPFGDILTTSPISMIGETLGISEITDMLDLGKMLGVNDIFSGLLDGDLEGITDIFGEIPLVGDLLGDPAILMAVAGAVIGGIIFFPVGIIIGAGLGLMIGSAMGDGGMASDMFNGLPVVGDLLGKDGLGGTLSGILGKIPLIGGLFGGGDGSSSKGAGKEEIKDRIAERRASQGVANGAVAQTAQQRAGEIDEAAEENAELAADIQKLIQLLMAMKNGGDPAALSGQMSELLSKIGEGGNIPGMEQHGEFFSQMQQAAVFAESGDIEAMLEAIDNGFSSEEMVSTGDLEGAQSNIGSVFSPIVGSEEDFGEFSIFQGAA